MLTHALANRILFKALEKTRHGRVRLTILEPHDHREFGEGELIADVRVTSPAVLQKLVHGGDVALASAIIDGEIAISDEAAFVEWACRNDDELKQAFHGSFLGTLLPRLGQIFRRNTVGGAKRNIMAHYDLGNDFYRSWLDATMTYSSAIFTAAERTDDLVEAQTRKYDRIIDELGIKAGDHVLEVGCGWGGFFSRAVERTGCKVTAVLNSPAQAAFARERARRLGIEKNVDLQLIDYRQIEGRFDKLVSIEMIEAVGREFWPVYFEKLSASLKSRGKALIQSITIRDDRFEEYARTPDFINTMIFPGGMLLTNSAIQSSGERAGLATAAAPFEFGLCYAETLRRWKDNFLAARRAGTLPGLDERFSNLWRFYLAYCEGAFSAGRINVGHFLLENAR